MNAIEYKRHLESLGIKYKETDDHASPTCLAVKAELVSKYHKNRLYDYYDVSRILSILTNSILCTIYFDIPEIGLVHISIAAITVIKCDNDFDTFEYPNRSKDFNCKAAEAVNYVGGLLILS